MYLGLDSSTQSLSALIIDPSSGKVLAEESVNFGNDLPYYGATNGFIPGGLNGEVHANPMMWLDALDMLFGKLKGKVDLSSVKVIAGSGQQHGSACFSEKFDHVLSNLNPAKSLSSQLVETLTRKSSPIWMDTSTTAECQEITTSLGGPTEVCARTGSVATERFTGPQIRRFYKQSPAAYAATSRIHLVSSLISSVLAGKSIGIDFGDGAGMNLLHLETLTWDKDLLEATAPRLGEKLLPAVSCLKPAGNIAPYFSTKYGFSSNCKICPFTGDNPASLVGMGATTPGHVVISLGTSDTFFAAMSEAKTDPKGYGHVFGNPAGGFMSLICFRNGSLAREALRDELGVDWSFFEKETMAETTRYAGKNITLPFYGPEITPRHDFTTPVTEFSESPSPKSRVRSLLEGQFLNMKLHSMWMEVKTNRILLTGGASKNDGIAQVVADVFQAPVERLEIANSAALGAALIAATADGNDLHSLQAAFCKPSPDSRIEPDHNLKENYSTALDAFARLLSKFV
jgi:xylulokinase